MGRKCYISFKAENIKFKTYIQENLSIDMIDKSLDEAIDSSDFDYIMEKIRQDHLADSTVTIHLIGQCSAENLGREEQKYIKSELQASLYNGQTNPRNGVLGIVLPEVKDKIFGGKIVCSTCLNTISLVRINDDSVITEFSYNYYIPNGKCHWTEEERYCVLVNWEDFCNEPEKYIEQAFEKRSSSIANKVKVRP